MSNTTTKNSDTAPKPWALDPEAWQSESDIWTCGIDIGDHGAAIECHADTKEAAIALATRVMMVAPTQPKAEDGACAACGDSGEVMATDGSGPFPCYQGCEKPQAAISDYCRVAGCVHAAHGCPTWKVGTNPFEPQPKPAEGDDAVLYIKHCADKLEAFGHRVTATALRAIAEEIRAPAADAETAIREGLRLASNDAERELWVSMLDRLALIERAAKKGASP